MVSALSDFLSGNKLEDLEALILDLITPCVEFTRDAECRIGSTAFHVIVCAVPADDAWRAFQVK